MKRLNAVHKRNLIISTVFIILLWICFSAFIHHTFQGNYWGAFTPATNLGPIPELEAKELGMFAINGGGWDSQYYYYSSNDPLGKRNIPQSDAYRMLKIGVPAVSFLISRSLGFNITYPGIYHLVQFSLVFLGFLFLINYLSKNNLSHLYAYGWILNMGTLNALFNGMPDASADAMLIITIVALLEKNLALYCFAAAYLCLIRDAYVIIPVAIAALSWFGIMREKFVYFPSFYKNLKKLPALYWEKHKNFLVLILTALPVVIQTCWSFYVGNHFKTLNYAPGNYVKGFLEFPFKWAFHFLFLRISERNIEEIYMCMISICIMFAALYVCIRLARKNAIWLALLAYVIIITCLNVVVWGNSTGYVKSMGALIIIIIFSLPYIKNRFFIRTVQIVLAFLAINGIYINYMDKKDSWMYEFESPVQEIENGKNINKISGFKYSINSDRCPKEIKSYQGFYKIFHRGFASCKIKLKNLGNTTLFKTPEDGVYSIKYYFEMHDSKDSVFLGFPAINNTVKSLPKSIKPNEEIEIKYIFSIPEKGSYNIKFGLQQNETKLIDNIKFPLTIY